MPHLLSDEDLLIATACIRGRAQTADPAVAAMHAPASPGEAAYLFALYDRLLDRPRHSPEAVAVTDDQIDAALDILRDSDGLPGAPPIRWFVRSPTDPPPGPERDAAVAALHQAEEQAERDAPDLVRRALEAALAAGGGEMGG